MPDRRQCRPGDQVIGNMAKYCSALIIANPGSLSDSLKKLLESTFQVKPACQVEDYETALGIVKQHRPELVVLDFNLPQGESLASLQLLKEACPQVPCLVMVDSEQDLRSAQSAGAEVVLIKGTPAGTFLKTIEELLGYR